MKNLERIVDHLAKLDPHFYGQVVIRIKGGKAVLITEERNICLDDRQTEVTNKKH